MTDRRAELLEIFAQIPPPKITDREWPHYEALGIGRDDIPALIGMLSDPALLEKIYEATREIPEVWAPLHCARALGQLQAAEAIPALLAALEDLPDDEWYVNDLAEVMALIGPEALPALASYLDAESGEAPYHCEASVPISAIGKKHPEAREECVRILAGQLANHAQNDPDLNGFLVSGLIDLKAAEEIDTIRLAYHSGHVAWSICGDLEEVELELGLISQRSTPRPRFNAFHAQQEAGGGAFDFPAQPLVRGEKTGRNDPCPCGSGKKYKKCCLNQA